jgi:hypothetical protein
MLQRQSNFAFTPTSKSNRFRPFSKLFKPIQKKNDAPQSAPTKPGHRLRSKIANLPSDHRDIINKLLLDGSAYVAVIARAKS